MDWSQASRHSPIPNCSTFSECENDSEKSLNFNLTSPEFINTYSIKVEREVSDSESCDEQLSNEDTNLQEIKLEPQFCITDENDLIEENHKAAGCDVKIKTEAEDTAADELSSNMHHIPFASIDNENLQDKDQLQNEITSELTIKSEHEWSNGEATQDNRNYGHDISEDTEKKTYAESVSEIGRQVDAGVAQMSSYTCQICVRVFQSESKLNKHLNKHKNSEINDKGLYECEVCNKEFDKSFILSLHKKTHLDLSTQCSKSFKSKSILETYLKAHSDVCLFKCDECSKSFKYKSNLINHSKLHTNLRPFKCQVCDKTFKSISNLHSHIKIHNDKFRLFACTQCDKKFTTNNDLLRHITVHSDLKPYACKICGKMFKSKHHINSHMNYVHKDDALNFKCDQCDKMFKKASSLLIHKKTHSTLRPFQCELCSKSFKFKSVFSRHVLVHSDVRPFSCDICSKSFKTKCDLKQHGVVHNSL